MKPLLSVQDLHLAYKSVPAVRGANLEIYPGDLRVILGANGAGKTSILKGILGIVKPVRGRVIFDDGVDLVKLQAHERFRLGISWVPEGRQLWTTMTVLENLRVAGEQLLKSRELESRLGEMLERFPQLAERRNQLSGLLSGGEQQMVALARALICKPRLVLMDEPSLGLAPLVVANVFALVRDINKAGTSVLMVEQNAKQSLRVANWAYLLENGVVVENGSAESMSASEKIKEVFLGGSVNATSAVGAAP
jgi:branched-chain amino acid transport system ATP-binding protein